MPEENKVSPASTPQKPRSFMSSLLHFFFNKGEKKKEEKENLIEPAPAVEIDIGRHIPGEDKAPVTLPPVKAEKKVPAKARPEKHKKKKVKQPPPPPQMDKKGFRILNDEHDLYRLFTEQKQDADRLFDESEDFARMLEKYLDDQGHRQMMQEKKTVPVKPKTAPLTVGERLKTYPAPQLELDLHGYTSTRAEAQTEAFLRSARQNDIRTVRIIVGKGLHSGGKAVLPDVVEKKIIACKQKRWVLAYKWEKKDKYKSGALIVYLIPL